MLWAQSCSLRRRKRVYVEASSVRCSMWLVGYLLSCSVLMKSISCLSDLKMYSLTKCTSDSEMILLSFVHYNIYYLYYITVCVLFRSFGMT